MPNSHRETLRIIVNGTPTDVEANVNQPLHVVAQHALNQTQQQGRPLSEWELRDSTGNVLDLNRTVESYGLVSGATLYLQPTVGVNGVRGCVRLVDPHRSVGFFHV